jgi:ATP-dependent protease ClpP protease subunit
MKIEAQIINNVGKINIIDTISENTSSNSKSISETIDDLLKNSVRTADVYINSRGGSVFEANEIVNQLKRLDEVVIIVGSIAASAATYILANFKSKCHENSQFMIHRPKAESYGDVKEIRADLLILENLTEDYKKTYSLKMGKTIDEIEDLFEAGDSWFNANDAKEIGLIDEILTKSSSDISSDYSPNYKPKIAASLMNTKTKDDILQGIIFNEHSLKSLVNLDPSDRLEVLCSTFDVIELKQDKESFFIDIVENEHRELANEWIADLTLQEKQQFKEFYPLYYNVFTQKPV